MTTFFIGLFMFWFGSSEQLVESALRGRVLDPTGKPIASVSIQISANGLEMKQLLTDGEGRFEGFYAPGTYQISVTIDGFEPYRREIELQQGTAMRFEITLEVEKVNQTVIVSDRAGYRTLETVSATKTPTALVNIPQAIQLIGQEQMRDQAMLSMADVVRYVPGITMAQGEGHRDAPIIRGNATTADFFVNGVRDDVQYFRDLYNLERVEALKGPSAMIFGRGGGGGVLNRVTKEAGFAPFRELTVQGGMFGQKRVTGDLDQPLNRWAALRLNAMFEDSANFRRYSDLNRYGVSPTVTLRPSTSTKVRLGYELFHDGRVVDRGIPSYRGLPLEVDRRQYFGNPEVSRSGADVHLGSMIVEQQWGAWNLRNQTWFGAYDKDYANVFPGAVDPTRTLVSLSGYNNATQRNNAFNQTDLVRNLKTGWVRHTVLTGVELGRQRTTNFRNTAYFNGSSTTLNAPLLNPVSFEPVVFRQAASDANNRVNNQVAATYAQDQIELGRYVQVVAGMRLDHFDLKLVNHRSQERLRRIDNMWSPRLGVVLKPMATLSLYGNYSVSFLPIAGDQFSSLTATNQSLKPEKFINREVGAKWDPARGISFSSAFYVLNRTNTTAADPFNPARIVQTGAQRSKGMELSLTGNVTRIWTIAGGYAWQDARIVSATTAAAAGARVAQVPRNSVSLWNQVRLLPRLGAGLGLIHQSAMFAGIDNTVRIPGFTRADASLQYSWSERLRLQANVENLTDRRYTVNAHTNNNLTPGAARTLRVTLITRF